MRMLTLTPAYGRDYKSKAAALADWNANKDFIIADASNRWAGKPINKSQAVGSGYYTWIRYDRLRKITRATS